LGSVVGARVPTPLYLLPGRMKHSTPALALAHERAQAPTSPGEAAAVSAAAAAAAAAASAATASAAAAAAVPLPCLPPRTLPPERAPTSPEPGESSRRRRRRRSPPVGARLEPGVVPDVVPDVVQGHRRCRRRRSPILIFTSGRLRLGEGRGPRWESTTIVKNVQRKRWARCGSRRRRLMGGCAYTPLTRCCLQGSIHDHLTDNCSRVYQAEDRAPRTSQRNTPLPLQGTPQIAYPHGADA